MVLKMLYAWQQIEYQLDVSLFSGLKANRNRMSNLIIFVVSYSIGLRVEQRASTSRQAAPADSSCTCFLEYVPGEVVFFFSFSPTDLLQVFTGIPTLLLPCGFHSRTCLVVSDFGFRKVWPIQFHLRLATSVGMHPCYGLAQVSYC